jgi:hypothetical protein
MGCHEEVPDNVSVAVDAIAVTLRMGGFMAAWIVRSRWRIWFEARKWQSLGWDQPAREP